MKKEVFVNILNKLKIESENANKISNGIIDLFKNNGRPFIDDSCTLADKIYSYELQDFILNELKNEFDDVNDYIYFYVYESCWGSEILSDDVSGITFNIKTPEELYDLLLSSEQHS